jgi:repressor LexA
MLTKRQKEILDYVKSYIRKNSFAPSLEEIANYFKLSSVATVHEHLENLKQKGYLHKEENQSRGIGIVNPSKKSSIPLLGIIAAGGPITAIRNHDTIEVPPSMLKRGSNYFALKVKGTSMIEEGISDGDIVLVREQNNVENGEKAVAYLPDKDAVTLKKLFYEKNRIKLVPANKSMKPFYERNVEIQGKVIGVLRKYE